MGMTDCTTKIRGKKREKHENHQNELKPIKYLIVLYQFDIHCLIHNKCHSIVLNIETLRNTRFSLDET